jgi:hypothetical protein
VAGAWPCRPWGGKGVGSVVVGEARALDVTATHLCQGKGSVSLFLNFFLSHHYHRGDLGGASCGFDDHSASRSTNMGARAVWQDKARMGTVARRGARRPF